MTLAWHTDLDSAVHEARRRHRPIVSLRLLGALDEELSCANSRFFKTLLYPDDRVHALMSGGAVLHWASVRPVPKVSVDFGDGRRLETTLTGNSVHLVLDERGRPVDALPGLVDAQTFTERLSWSLQCAGALRERSGAARTRALAKHHQRRLALLAPPVPRRSRARAASELAMTKHMVEGPILDALERNVADDTNANTTLHRRVHAWFAAGRAFDSAESFTRTIYEELFVMPLDDPWLGLSPDLFNGLTDLGRR